MVKLTTVMGTIDKDSRFHKALEMLRMQKQLHLNMEKTGPTQFPPALMLEQLPYTVMNFYKQDERVELFGNDSTTTDSDDNSITPTVNKFTHYNSKLPSKHHNSLVTQQLTRARLPKFCPSCGVYGHDVFTNGCDFTASWIKVQRFLK